MKGAIVQLRESVTKAFSALLALEALVIAGAVVFLASWNDTFSEFDGRGSVGLGDQLLAAIPAALIMLVLVLAARVLWHGGPHAPASRDDAVGRLALWAVLLIHLAALIGGAVGMTRGGDFLDADFAFLVAGIVVAGGCAWALFARRTPGRTTHTAV
jgi:uncharacterized membrane protein